MSTGRSGHSPRARRARGAAEEEHENSERWAISYMDMVTVMMCLFIVLFAISQVDQRKLEVLAGSLGAALGSDGGAQVHDGGAGILDATSAQPEAPVDGVAPTTVPVGAVEDGTVQAAREEVARWGDLRDLLQADLAAAGVGQDVDLAISERGLVVGLLAENVGFDPASAALTSTTARAVDVVSARLAGLPHHIDVEGHANTLPVHGRYATNWELSADRAVQVLRRLTEGNGIDPGRVRALAYGDAHPVYRDEPDAVDRNRRVDLVVLSDAPDDVREAVATLLADGEGA